MVERVIYLNGDFVSPENANVSIFDRGILFGDGVYEVAGVLNGKLLEFDYHMARLKRSLKEIAIPQPLNQDEILDAFRKLIALNQLKEGLVYMQVTRGAAERDFVYDNDLTPTVFMFTQKKSSIENEKVSMGVKLKTVQDIRWARRDIKSTNLLGQVLAKQEARNAGAYEALMIGADGYITECGATSFFIYKNNAIITRPLSSDILAGVTRKSILELCYANQLRLEQRLFTLAEAINAEEAFITGASTYVLPVTQFNSTKIGDGLPGPATLALREIYIQHIKQTAI